MKCYMCGWQGHPDDLVSITDEPESINDFVHCPVCKCNVWTEPTEDEAEEDKTRLCLKEDSTGNWQPLFSEGFM